MVTVSCSLTPDEGQRFEPIPQPPGVARLNVLPGLEIELAPLFAELGSAGNDTAYGPDG